MLLQIFRESSLNRDREDTVLITRIVSNLVWGVITYYVNEAQRIFYEYCCEPPERGSIRRFMTENVSSENGTLPVS